MEEKVSVLCFAYGPERDGVTSEKKTNASKNGKQEEYKRRCEVWNNEYGHTELNMEIWQELMLRSCCDTMILQCRTCRAIINTVMDRYEIEK